MRLKLTSIALWAVTILLAISPARASELPAPTGPVVLTVDGAISTHNGDGVARFDLEMLKALGVHKLVTTTFWTDGKKVFEGVLMRDILNAVGAKGTLAIAYAIDDYSSAIPIADFADFDVIDAFSMNETALTRRDKGPLWIVYPWD